MNLNPLNPNRSAYAATPASATTVPLKEFEAASVAPQGESYTGGAHVTAHKVLRTVMGQVEAIKRLGVKSLDNSDGDENKQLGQVVSRQTSPPEAKEPSEEALGLTYNVDSGLISDFSHQIGNKEGLTQHDFWVVEAPDQSSFELHCGIIGPDGSAREVVTRRASNGNSTQDTITILEYPRPGAEAPGAAAGSAPKMNPSNPAVRDGNWSLYD
jgi:hypothetical protein